MFVDAAVVAERAGWEGAQVHSAHGYLLAEYLSPLVSYFSKQKDVGADAIDQSRLLTPARSTLEDPSSTPSIVSYPQGYTCGD